jgi:Rrf2 family nitric oxide-sensitive transcriptional repressor
VNELSETTVRGLSALHVLMHAQRPVTARAIAAGVKAPATLLRSILSKLSRAGLVQGRIGRGYVLARAPGEIRLEDIIRALEEPQEPSAPCGGNFEACPSRASCVLSLLCRKADESFTEASRTFTLADLRELAPDVPNCMDPEIKCLTAPKAKRTR